MNIQNIKKNQIIEYENHYWLILDINKISLPRLIKNFKIILKNIKNGQIIEKIFPIETEFKSVIVEHKELEYEDKNNTNYVFVDLNIQKDIFLNKEQIKNIQDNLKKSEIYTATYVNNEFIEIKPPHNMELKVLEIREITQNENQAILETGLKIIVDKSIKPNDIVLISTNNNSLIKKL